MINVRRINSATQNSVADKDLYLFFRNSIIGRFYLNELKQYSTIRKTVLWVWPKFLFVYVTFLKAVRASLPLKSLSKCESKKVLYPEEQVQVFPAQFYPPIKPIKKDNFYVFPEIFIATIQQCTVIGASNFLWTCKEVFSLNLFRFDYDYTSEELHGRYYINKKKSSVTSLSKINTKNEIESGIIFTDAVSFNYAHFLTEVLPRVYAYSKHNNKPLVPLIINSGLHLNLLQALEFVVGTNIDIIGLEIGEPLKVRSLQVVSACGYVPFQRRPKSENLTDHSEGAFSSSILVSMRDSILSKIPKKNNVENLKKIFIKRNSNYRNLQNTSEIEQKLIAEGFAIVEPEKLSFADQVEVFSNAEVVIGATGAAFANLIFCRSNTKIIILIADFEHMIYGYWQNMASAVGNRVTYIVGKTKDAQFHSDFHINADTIMRLIRN